MSGLPVGPWRSGPMRIDMTQDTAERRAEKMAALAVSIEVDGAHVRQETVGVYWIWTVAK